MDRISLTQERGEEGQPQQFLVRATFSSFSRPSHLEILVLPILFSKILVLQDGMDEILNFNKLKK